MATCRPRTEEIRPCSRCCRFPLLSLPAKLGQSAALLGSLCVLLLAPQAVSAQYGPPASGSWGPVVVTGNGTVDYYYTWQGIFSSGSRPWGNVQYGPGELIQGVGSDSGYPAHAATHGTVTVIRKWTGPNPAPKSVYILEQSSATATAGGGGAAPGTATASDAFGDPTLFYRGGEVAQSSGGRLIQKDSSSGVISLSGTISASGDTVPLPNGAFQGQCIANGYYGWDFDTRAVTITSSLGQTAHKSTTHVDSNGIALPDLDVPDADGTTNATTVKPDPTVDELIAYKATPIGAWAANSAYFWHIVQGNPYVSLPGGTFTLPSDLPNNYSALYSLASTKTGDGREHVYIHLTSASDGANATNNYYISWHDAGENWQNQGSSVEITPKLFGASDSAQPANGFANIRIAPDTVDWSVGTHIGGGIVTTGAAVLAVVQPETSPFLLGFLTAAGYTLSLTTPPDPTIYTPQGTLAQFTTDVNTQNTIAIGTPAGIFMPGNQRISPALAKQIATSGDYSGYFTGARGPTFQFTVETYRHRFAQNRIGDGYGAQGYYGSVSGTLYKSGSLEYVYNWK